MSYFTIRTGDRLLVGDIEVNARTLTNAYQMFYPATWNQLSSQNLFHYLHLFGIRVSTDDPFAADDIVGGLRITNANVYELANSRATVEPGTSALAQLYDSEARARGGAAYMKEGQNAYYLLPRRNPKKFNKNDLSGWELFVNRRPHKFTPHAFFCPLKPVPVYGWRPDAIVRTTKSQKDWLKSHTIGSKLYKGFKDSLTDFKNKRPSNIKDSTSRDTCIHRAWSSGVGVASSDSAGCQVLKDNYVLNTLGDWAVAHINKGYTNTFIYTLFTAEQFTKANQSRGFTFTLPNFSFTLPKLF
jgi:hypothetical protein